MDRLLARVYRHPAFASLVLGAIAATGFAPLDLWPLTLLAFAGWIALLHRAGSLKQALWIGYAFGVGTLHGQQQLVPARV